MTLPPPLVHGSISRIQTGLPLERKSLRSWSCRCLCIEVLPQHAFSLLTLLLIFRSGGSDKLDMELVDKMARMGYDQNQVCSADTLSLRIICVMFWGRCVPLRMYILSTSLIYACIGETCFCWSYS